MPDKIDPIRPTDDEARALARQIMDTAGLAALGVIEPGSGAPSVTRIAVMADEAGGMVFLTSDLSGHTRALDGDPRASLLVGDPPVGRDGRYKGDPLAFPRLTLIGRATRMSRDDPARAGVRAAWLTRHPKAALYVDFADFAFWRLSPERALLNGGFGRAFLLTADDLRPVAA